MKHIITFSLIILCFSSCAVQSALVGNYNITNTATTNKSYNEVWDAAVDFFANSGYAISTIEKASGLIVAKTVTIDNDLITYESGGKPYNPYAYVITSTKNATQEGTVDFNVRIKNIGNRVQVTVNLLNININYFDVFLWLPVSQAMSTGVFESNLLDYILY